MFPFHLQVLFPREKSQSGVLGGIDSCHGGTSLAGAENHGWLRTSSQWQLGPDEGSIWASIFMALLWKKRFAGFQRLFSKLDRRIVKKYVAFLGPEALLASF